LFFSKIDFEAIYSDLDKSGKVVIVNKPWWRWLLPRLFFIGNFFFFGNEEGMSVFWKCFDDFEKVFKWDEVKKLYKPLHYIFSAVNNYNMKTNYSITRITHWLACLLSVYNFFRVFIHESHSFKHLQNNNVNLIMTNISFALIRKEFEKSYGNFYKKTKYEK
jgi:hypothetical protein